ncbi:MAG: site-specific integrase [Deltaproteobacteria bacterium]|nr:site-specific integrase [Deltaproteobacteria bacterium]
MSIHKRGKQGIYYFNFTINGKKYFRSTGSTSKREAKQVEHTERQRLMKEGKLSPQEKAARTTLKDAIEITYNSKWKNNKDATGTYRKALRLLELIGNIPVGTITEETVDTLIKTLEATKIEGATINRYQATLKTILKQMKQPAEIFTPFKESKGRIRVVSKDEEIALLRLLRDTEKPVYLETADLVECLLDTGCRLSEMLDLLYQDIDFQNNQIRIWINKGDRPRSIPMTTRVKSILLARKQSDKPFSITKYQADKCWAWVRKQMGLEGDSDYVIHSCRHTCASRLVNAGVDLYVVKEWLGHSTIKITERYAHLDPGKLVTAMGLLEGLK